MKTPTANLSDKDVLAQLESAYRKNPTRPENVLNLAEAYQRAGRFGPGTKDVFSRSLQLRPRNAGLLKSFSVVCLVKEASDFVEASTKNYREQLDQKKLTQLAENIEKLAGRYPYSPDILAVQADLLLLTGKAFEALTRYEQATRTGGTEPEHVAEVVIAAVKRRDIDEDVLMHLTSLLEECGAYLAAATVAREVVTRSTSEGYVLNLYARILEHAVRQERDPAKLDAWRIEISQVLHKLGRKEEALAHLQHFAPGALRDYDMVKQISRLLIKSKDYAAAFQHLQNIPLDDEAITLLNEIAIAQEGEGNIEAAVRMLQYVNTHHESIREAHEAEERDIELSTELATAELDIKNERYEEALERLVSLYQSGHPEVEELLRQIDRVVPNLPISSYPSLFQLAKTCVERGRFSQAAVYITRVWQAWPNDEAVQDVMRQVYNGLIARNPNVPEIRLKSAQLYQHVQDYENAISEYEYCMKFPEVKVSAQHALGICHLQAEQFQDALKVYSKLRLEEEDLEPLYALYEIFTAEKDYRKSLKALNLIRKQNPQYRDIEKKIAAIEDRLSRSDGQYVVDPKMKNLIGDLAEVGRYRYIAKIGSGGMGVVHKVYDMKTNSIVAMKILREGLAGSGKAIDRFYREARIAGKLNHPNIVNVFDYSIANVHGNSYITMEYIDGPSLRDLIERKFASTIDITMDDVCEALFYLAQICSALCATHDNGIIHRDIKPDNVLINAEGIAKITDFGIVHVEEATFTPTGAMVGTPRYMSPEQVQGRKLDGRSDIYSAGIILYELLVGSPPFVSGDVSYQHVNVVPTTPQTICPIIPDPVNAVIMKALEKKATDRFENAEAMQAEVEKVLEEINEHLPRTPAGFNTEVPNLEAFDA